MKDSLTRHIGDIMDTLHINDLYFEIYDCRNDELPDWINQVSRSHEFLVCCDQNPHENKLRKFLGKNIMKVGNHLYWFEGATIMPTEYIEAENQYNTTGSHDTPLDYLKTETRLPAWLDDFLFNILGAEYAPDCQRFEYNLDLTEEENLKYLGTYFPRSYAESFCIFDNVFQNKVYQQVISKKSSFNILSIGCGTGGDIIGLLTVIEKYCSHINKVKIWAIDGNKDALSLLVKILDKYKAKTNITIELQTITTIFADFSNVNISKTSIPNIDYDFILCFKMICEMIAIGKENAYCNFVKKFVPLLSESGLCLLLDVTVQSKYGTFLPILMNRQVNQALRELKGYQTLLPLSCGKFENICTEQCFTQQHFHVTHKKKSNDLSKVSYRLMGRNDFVKSLVGNTEMQKYVLQRNGRTTFCPKSESEIITDAYKLKN
jgi:hypothetical protein